jgi:hypothetical protein
MRDHRGCHINNLAPDLAVFQTPAMEIGTDAENIIEQRDEFSRAFKCEWSAAKVSAASQEHTRMSAAAASDGAVSS